MLLRAHRTHHPAHRKRRPDRGVSAAATGEPVIALQDVSVRREGFEVLSAVDWRVDATDRWVILGPNGSGKTTLLQVASARL